MAKKRFYDFNTYLHSLYGEKVYKITIDAGLTCPNRDGTLSTGGCIFCNEKGSGTGNWQAQLSIREQIQRAQQFLQTRSKAKKFLAYFQSFSNTYAPLTTLGHLYEEALAMPGIIGLCIGTRPDCIYPEVLDLLDNYGRDRLIWLEYGLQSIHDSTLQKINRGHGLREFLQAVEETKLRKNINICVHIILGLPGENKDDMIATAQTLSRLGIQGIKLHLLYVVKNTILAEMYNRGEYTCLEREEYINILAEFIQYLPPDMIIHRLISDPHPNELVAPLWALDRLKNRQMIENAFEIQNIRQGAKNLRNSSFPLHLLNS